MKALSWAILVLLFPTVSPAVAQIECSPPPSLAATEVSAETKVAVDTVHRLLGALGIELDVRGTRDSVLRDHPRAEQAYIVLTMASNLCQMIVADPNLSPAEKATLYTQQMLQIMVQVQGPSPVASTQEEQGSRQLRYSPPIMLAFAPHESRHDVMTASLLLAQQLPSIPSLQELQSRQSGWLREQPFYITDYNKYFVIVASARTEEEGREMLRRLKSKVPQHDFHLYAPYGTNTYYGIMIASWVSRDVALEALNFAREHIASDAFLFACRSKGEVC